MPVNVAAFSGGKDSTCMVLRTAEAGTPPDELLFTPTGNELPECLSHVARVAALSGSRLVVRSCGKSLQALIREQNALPNQNMRWCTRVLKIETAKAYLLERPGSTLWVGLRADEEHRPGMWGDFVSYRYPLRELGWGVEQVWGYLDGRGVTVPDRTDCALCYDQRLSEWYRLWKQHPDLWAEGEAFEALTGHTFRSATRDTWPASLRDLRAAFEGGRVPRDIIPLPLFGTYAVRGRQRCRACSM
jgi:PP-loop superfamily ATP-utilizing enzyme